LQELGVGNPHLSKCCAQNWIGRRFLNRWQKTLPADSTGICRLGHSIPRSLPDHRLRAHHQLAQYPSSAIQDRSVYEDAEIFAHNLFLQGHIRPRDYQTYRELYLTLVEFLPPPDLVIYLHASVPTLVQRIAGVAAITNALSRQIIWPV